MLIVRAPHRFVVAVALCAAAASLSAQPGPGPIVPAPPPARDGTHDFDFLHGTWFVHSRQMPQPLSGRSMEYTGVWFNSRTVVRPLASGPAAIIETDATLPDSSHRREVSLLTYNSPTRQWTIRRIDVQTGALQPPLSGNFVEQAGGILSGDFVGQQEFESRTVLVRHHWRIVGLNWAQWEQAFSADGGRTWETNWYSRYSRVGDTSRANRPEPISVKPSIVNGEQAAAAECCDALELHRYELPEVRVRTMSELFDQENTATRGLGGGSMGNEYFIGLMENIALLRDIDRPNIYIWLRGFRTLDEMQVRGFYDQSLWARHTDVLARAEIASGDATILAPSPITSAFLLGARGTSPIRGEKAELLVATVYTVPSTMTPGFENFFQFAIVPRVFAAGGRPVASFATKSSLSAIPGFRSVVNPRASDGDRNFVWFARFADAAAYAQYQTKLARDQEWKDNVEPKLKTLTSGPPEVWRLVPVWQWRPIF